MVDESVRGTQILLAAFTTYRRRFRRVAGAALLVLVPLAIVNAFLASETDRFDRLTGWIPEWLDLLNSAAAAVGSLGAVFYAGLLDRVVAYSEGLGIKAAFRRSARLARGHFWLVLLLVTIPLGAEEALLGAVEEMDIEHELVTVVLLQVVLAVGVTAFVGLVAVTLAYELAGRESPGEELLAGRG